MSGVLCVTLFNYLPPFRLLCEYYLISTFHFQEAITQARGSEEALASGVRTWEEKEKSFRAQVGQAQQGARQRTAELSNEVERLLLEKAHHAADIESLRTNLAACATANSAMQAQLEETRTNLRQAREQLDQETVKAKVSWIFFYLQTSLIGSQN